ncbi:hypothetical protein K488DRAFT_50577 [Vararia minispora EC-137]|uniref:Uncharacterized protein n=1 Tax=Vararia minispora EC-137 TaxID=1314806 RepID=A0ACB8QL82_9AGAM|nr:hypothetical protein K488DRAFT_50577 [Vararia minispora EC-137]
MTSLVQYKVSGANCAHYIPDFVTPDEETYLLRKIEESPQPRWKKLANRRLQIWGGDLAQRVLIPQPLPTIVTTYPDLVSRLAATGAFAGTPHGAPNHIIMNEYLPGQGIMPHEDGPAYHPVVATLSLGAHTVMNYYRYAPDTDGVGDGGGESGELQRGRAIDPAPVMSLLLEPRSIVITSGKLYTAHLHGIDAREADAFLPAGGERSAEVGTGEAGPVRVANAHMLTGAAARAAVRDGGVLRRGTRYSLTCRDVGRVSGAGRGLGRVLRR